jgi:hypothetical protein
MGKQSTRIATALAASLLWLVTGAAPRAAELNSGYIVTNQGALGITRAFDDGQNTVLAFVDLDNQTPQLSGGDGQKIKFRQVDNYAVLPGKFDEVRVTTAGNNSGVMRSAAIQAPVVTAPEAPVVATPVTPVASAPTAFAAVVPNATVTSTNDDILTKSERKPAAQTMALSGDMLASNTAKSSATASAFTKPVAANTGTAVAVAPVNSPVVAPEPSKPTWQGKTPTDAKETNVRPGEPAHTEMHSMSAHAVTSAWSTGTNTSLIRAVNGWAAKSGWRVLWKASMDGKTNDRRIEAPLNFDGTFQEAIKGLFELYQSSPHPFMVDSYPRQLPPLVVITELN